jgi:hypothetical protein
MGSKQLRYIYGSLLPQVCHNIGVEPTQQNKETVKAMLKKAAGIDTLGRMTTDDDFTHNIRLSRFISNSAMLLSSEFAMEVDLPWETGIAEQDMMTFLKSIYHE